MTIRRAVLALLVALLALATAAPPLAYAGGPTSVLMVNPSREQARAAYVSDPVYVELTAALGEGTTGPTEAPAGVEGGEEVRLTWLIHDVQIWRIDRVFIGAGDSLWVETVTDFSGDGRMFGRPASWHRPADAKALTAALSASGLLGTDGGPPAEGAPTAAVSTEGAVPAAAIATLAGLGGLVLGGLLVGARERGRRGRPAEAAPARTPDEGVILT